MTGMLLVPSNIMKSLAVGAIVVGITSVLAALTLLPALLGLLGDRRQRPPGALDRKGRRPPGRPREQLLGRDRPRA